MVLPIVANRPVTPERQDLSDVLFYGMDNLEVVQGIDTESIDLIATDPPFKNNGEVYQGSGTSVEANWRDLWTWQDSVHGVWWESIQKQHLAAHDAINAIKTSDPAMGAYAAAMAARLLEFKRILKSTGSIYVHCDPDVSPYWRILMNAVFGAENFKREIVWKRSTAHNDKQAKHGGIHDTILFYTKTDRYTWNRVYTEYDPEYVKKNYKYTEEHTGRKYQLDNLAAPGGRGAEYELMGVTRIWRYSRENMDELIAEGRIIQARPGGVPRYKRYLDEMPGVVLQDLWTDILPLSSASLERKEAGWGTQKPVELYERIIKTSSNPGDIVFDPFCGSGTTLIAANNLERRWIGVEQLIEGRTTIERRLPVVKASAMTPTRTDDARTAFDEMDRLGLGLLEVPPDTVYRNNDELREELRKMYGPWCAGCGFVVPQIRNNEFELEHLHADHIKPRANNGADRISNRMLLCGPCNNWKGAKYTLDELLTHNREFGRVKNEALIYTTQLRYEDACKVWDKC